MHRVQNIQGVNRYKKIHKQEREREREREREHRGEVNESKVDAC